MVQAPVSNGQKAQLEAFDFSLPEMFASLGMVEWSDTRNEVSLDQLKQDCPGHAVAIEALMVFSQHQEFNTDHVLTVKAHNGVFQQSYNPGVFKRMNGENPEIVIICGDNQIYVEHQPGGQFVCGHLKGQLECREQERRDGTRYSVPFLTFTAKGQNNVIYQLTFKVFTDRELVEDGKEIKAHVLADQRIADFLADVPTGAVSVGWNEIAKGEYNVIDILEFDGDYGKSYLLIMDNKLSLWANKTIKNALRTPRKYEQVREAARQRQCCVRVAGFTTGTTSQGQPYVAGEGTLFKRSAKALKSATPGAVMVPGLSSEQVVNEILEDGPQVSNPDPRPIDPQPKSQIDYDYDPLGF